MHARVAVAHVRRVAFDVGEASVAQLAVGVHHLDDGPRRLLLLLAGPCQRQARCWRESRQLAVAYGKRVLGLKLTVGVGCLLFVDLIFWLIGVVPGWGGVVGEDLVVVFAVGVDECCRAWVGVGRWFGGVAWRGVDHV